MSDEEHEPAPLWLAIVAVSLLGLSILMLAATVVLNVLTVLNRAGYGPY